MFIVLVQVQVRPELLAEFETAILENAARSVEREPGCLRFDVVQQEDDPTKWVFFEVYEDAAAWAEHGRSPHFLAYKAVADRALVLRVVTRGVGRHIERR